MQLQVDIPDELNRELKIYRLLNKHKNMPEAVLNILKEKFAKEGYIIQDNKIQNKTNEKGQEEELKQEQKPKQEQQDNILNAPNFQQGKLHSS